MFPFEFLLVYNECGSSSLLLLVVASKVSGKDETKSIHSDKAPCWKSSEYVLKRTGWDC